MKKRITTIGCIAVAAILMAFIGCAILWTPQPQNDPTKLIPVDNVKEIYDNAANLFYTNGTGSLELKITQQLLINNESFAEQTKKSISFQGYGSDELKISSNEQFSIGDYTISISEAYFSGTAYTTVDGSNFSASMSAQEYQSRMIPAALFDSALYETILGFDNGSAYYIYFKNTSEIEHWAAKDGWTLVGAQGFTSLNHDGQFLKSAYVYSCTLGEYTMHCTVYIEHVQSETTILIPEDSSSYTQISYLDAPRILERACGYLLLGKNIAANYNDRIFCQAFGDERTKNIMLYTAESESFAASIETETILINTSHVGDITKHLHKELFLNGSYTLRADHGEPAPNETITAEAMNSYCKDQLVSTIMMPQDILNSECEILEDIITIKIMPNESFAELVSANACQTLYQKPSLLNELATSHTIEKLECYLNINKATGLPINTSIEYDGSYTIEGIPYRLQYNAEQSYEIANPNIYNIITKAAG